VTGRRWIPLALLAALAGAGCSEEGSGGPASGPPDGDGDASRPASREAWWTAATERAGGRERILAPRELRALLAEGRSLGFDADAAWWKQRREWAFERILEVDPGDPDANAGVGNRTLQDIPGFRETWDKMMAADPTEEVSALLDAYETAVTAGRPVYLGEREFATLSERFRAVREHLERVETDPEYVALQRALREVRRGALSDYPHVRVRRGPFLVFYTARDLQRVPGEDPAAEDARLEARRAFHKKELEGWVDVYTDLTADLARAFPELWARQKPRTGDLFCHWVFGDRVWYVALQERLRKVGAEAPYRCGFYHGATGWAYLYDPVSGGEEDGEPAAVRRESAAYLAARQLLRHWGQDPRDFTVNRLDRSRAYWLKEGWPAYVAARQMKEPIAGRTPKLPWELPPIRDVIQRRSRLDAGEYLRPDAGVGDVVPPDGGFTDLACHVVRWLHEHKGDALVRFLLSQTDGAKRGIDWFEECFGIGPGGWDAFGRAVYAPLRE